LQLRLWDQIPTGSRSRLTRQIPGRESDEISPCGQRSRSLATPSLSCLALEVSTPPGRFVFGSNIMSNLIPSLETFAKAGRPSIRSFLLLQCHALYSATRGVFFFGKRYFAWIVSSWPVYLLYVLGDGCDGCRIGHAWSVFISFRIHLCESSPRRNGPAILWPELPHLPQRIPSRRTGTCVHPLSFSSLCLD
jgi:hypothetical protein